MLYRSPVQRLARLRPHAPAIAIAAAVLALACGFAATVLAYNGGTFGLPLEDAYIYLTYAKQWGRLEPFSYFPGGGYSAGSTSALWPMVIAPFWTLGARGHALVWVSFGLCTVLYAAACIASYRLVRVIAGELVGWLAAAMILAIAPFAWASLSGMEVAFASALLVWMMILLARTPPSGPPSRWMIACLAAASLSRPEAMMIVLFVAGVAAVNRARRREWKAAALWLVPLIAPAAWLTANRVYAGTWMPNTGVAKSHFYMPGFDLTYWVGAVFDRTVEMLEGLFWKSDSPFVLPKLFALLWLVGAVRVARWARREGRRLLGFVIVTSPLGLVMSVIASSGAWDFHHYRYVAPAFPLFAITAACAFAPMTIARWPEVWVTRGHAAAVGVFALVLGLAAVRPMHADMKLYAQNAVDLEKQVVTIGKYVRERIPDAHVMFHDAGAIAYYGDTRVFDMLGLVTNRHARVANSGPGARFEFLERMPPDQRPTHIAYYASWMGQSEFFGTLLLETPVAPPFASKRLIGGNNMSLYEADWDHVGSAERPLVPNPGWRMVDRVDIADLESEAAHRWNGEIGRREYGNPGARWSLVHKDTAHGYAVDGGRTIRGKRERFTLFVEPGKPVRLVVRSGGKPVVPFNETLKQGATLRVNAVEVKLPAPAESFVEIPIELAAPRERELEVTVEADRPYRVFHWFALQPE
jgi:hypothetical protein